MPGSFILESIGLLRFEKIASALRGANRRLQSAMVCQDSFMIELPEVVYNEAIAVGAIRWVEGLEESSRYLMVTRGRSLIVVNPCNH